MNLDKYLLNILPIENAVLEIGDVMSGRVLVFHSSKLLQNATSPAQEGMYGLVLE